MFVSCLERLRLVSLFLPAFVKSFSPILSGGFRARGTAPITSRIYAHSCHPSCRCVLFLRIAKKFISAAGPQIRIHSSIVYAPILRPVKCQFSLDTSRRRFTLTSVSLGRGGRGRSEPAINLPICSRVVAHIFARTDGEMQRWRKKWSGPTRERWWKMAKEEEGGKAGSIGRTVGAGSYAPHSKEIYVARV